MVDIGHAVAIFSDGKLSVVREFNMVAIAKWWEELP